MHLFITAFVLPLRPLLPAARADAAAFWPLLADPSLVWLCLLVADDLSAAAGPEAEADEVAEVTKQLEKQAIEDKEKEEDGEEGECLKHPSSSY